MHEGACVKRTPNLRLAVLAAATISLPSVALRGQDSVVRSNWELWVDASSGTVGEPATGLVFVL